MKKPLFGLARDGQAHHPFHPTGAVPAGDDEACGNSVDLRNGRAIHVRAPAVVAGCSAFAHGHGADEIGRLQLPASAPSDSR